MDRKLVGILFGCACYGVYSLHYATMKWLETDYPLSQLIFIRSLFMVVIAVGLGRRKVILAALASPYKGSTALRGTLQMISLVAFYLAAAQMPLADVTTIYSTAPLMTVVLSVLFLGEKAGVFGWIAVAAGLAGTLVAANPSAAVTLWPALLALTAGLFWAVTVVLTRVSGARESSSVQLLTTGVIFMAMSACFMTWKTPETWQDWGLMALLGVQIYLAQYFFFEACRFAPASLVGPLEYTSLIWACLLGFSVFGDIPPVQVLVGALLVAAGGVALAIGSRRPGRAAVATAETVQPIGE